MGMVFKLLPDTCDEDPSSVGPEALVCLVWAAELGVELEIEVGGTIGTSHHPTTGAATQRPALVTSDGALFSAVAICKYLTGLAATQRLSNPAKSSFAQACVRDEVARGPEHLKSEDLIFWAISAAGTSLTSLNKFAIESVLSRLETLLSEPLTDGKDRLHLTGENMGLADLFLFSRVAVSPVYRYSALKRQFFTEKRERLTKWMTRIESSPSVKSSIQSHPGLRWACSESSGSSPTSAGSDNVYITTAINYTNGAPHMGHAYEGIMADAIARYHRCHGRDVFFLTGSDEHGQKVAAAAEKEGVAPIDICNKYAKGFQSLNEKLKVTADKYIRTSDPVHYSGSQ
eukprot:GHVN01082732.1.p1 GENE.GHVN01082732.1~~GHVN01082732.1.p1  ORF type:complete len:344 (+),score=45.40 GHVN01082732.1:86-1117(+)